MAIAHRFNIQTAVSSLTTYNADNQMDSLLDWSNNSATYQYDTIGRLITTTLPTGIRSINRYDDAGRLLQLTHWHVDDTLIADFEYEVDGIGNRQMVTETVYSPSGIDSIETFLEENGLLVLEAESGLVNSGTSTHQWVSASDQVGFAGESYMEALPDIGVIHETDTVADAPMLSYRFNTTTPATYTVWVRGLAPNAAGDSLHIGLDNAPVATADKLSGFQPSEWDWSRLTMDNSDATVDLTTSGTYTLNLWMREDGLRVDRVLLVTDTAYIPVGEGPPASVSESVTGTMAGGLTSHTITYGYDNLYRLTDATYAGDTAATYSYHYDTVGNMTALTETVGTISKRLLRYYDDANRLEVENELDIGSSSYLYDNNGNLTLIIPPNGGSWLHYTYDQRNLMLSHSTSISDTNSQLVATYLYDGNSARVQQTDHSGAQAITTTYINDVLGLTQVLVADDGAEQVYNLFGLDLIAQDDETAVRYLLTDGLGSVRTEIVDNAVESLTTYDPFGNTLKQIGNSGTTYGFTGEQYDETTNMLYLRARYYNPSTHSFMSRDPWNGDQTRPQSLNGWNYVEDNPVNLIDLTGLFPNLPDTLPAKFPDFCKTQRTKSEYVTCVRDAFNLDRSDRVKLRLHKNLGTSNNEIFDRAMARIQGGPGCYWGQVPYRGKGYSEGAGGSASIVAFGRSNGKEVVYDFAKFQQAVFTYEGLIFPTDSVLGITPQSETLSHLRGLTSWKSSIDSDYGGRTFVRSSGLAFFDIGFEFGISYGRIDSYSLSDIHVQGEGVYSSYGIALGFPVLEFSDEYPIYTLERGSIKSYILGMEDIDVQLLVNDILSGSKSPWGSGFLNRGRRYGDPSSTRGRIVAAKDALWYAIVYKSMKLGNQP